MKRYILLVAFAIVWINPIYSQFPKYHLMKDASAVLSPRSADYPADWIRNPYICSESRS